MKINAIARMERRPRYFTFAQRARSNRNYNIGEKELKLQNRDNGI